MKDHYATLGVRPKASAAEIKEAYRKIAIMTHPDTHPGDARAAERFRQATEAYGALSDQRRRKKYDQEIAPITSLPDLFIRSAAGRDFLEATLPSAPAAYRRGNDEILVCGTLVESVGEDGRTVVNIARPSPGTGIACAVEAPAVGRPWLKIERFGGAGKNGGRNGDLYVFFPSLSAAGEDNGRKTTRRLR